MPDAVLNRNVTTPDGVQLHYEVLGSDRPGAPVLMLANGLGGKLYAWEAVVHRFAPTHRILTWDYRGLFRSSPPDTLKGLSIGHHADDAIRILDEEGVERAHFVGWSMGCMVSLEAALESPRRVSSLTLINGTYGQIFDRGLQPFMRLPAVPRLMHRLVEGLARRPGLTSALAAAACHPLHLNLVGGAYARLWSDTPHAKEMYATYLRDVFGPSFNNYLRLFQALEAHSNYHLLPEVSQRTLVVAGGFDWLTPAGMSRRIARRIPDAELLYLPFASHFALLEYGQKITDRMDGFLRPLKVHPGGQAAKAATA